MTTSCGFLAVLVLCGLACVLAEADKKWMAPKFCNGLECPRYTVVETNADYEVRQYESSPWVTTTEEGIDYDEHTSPMFGRLFNYITGTNAGDMTIDMTSPVLVRVIPGAGPACTNNFTMAFYLAPKVTSPPKPSDSLVQLGSLPAQKVYVRSFGGYADGMDYLRELTELHKSLPEGTDFEKSYWFTAGYDSPFKPWNRHNEVWLVAM